ncbi:MAG TPA: class I SAM-dependent methyltransferase [Solirubrobacterales bacterium]|nr:class I SAM-dependent methyltransferase [Solirubrobacterales bacterium]
MKQQTRSRIASGLDRARLLGPAARVRDRWLALRADDDISVGPDGLPLPPPRLRQLVNGRGGGAEHFVRIGAQMSATIRGAAAAAGSPMEQMDAILDFGCGCGRVVRHWADLDRPRVHGCDYNPELVDWCAANLSFVEAARNDLAPPAPYAGGSFDLIYALSVFSHLGEPLQEDWVAEFRRLLRPGGLLVLSVLGEKATHRLTAEERERFGRGELVVERPRMEGHNACTAYHPRPYVTDSLLADFADVTVFDLGSPELPVMQDAYIARCLT